MGRDGIVHVVDDDLAVRKALAFLLAMSGLSTRVYASGTAFLDLLPEVAPGCVVTDVRMAGVDGIELLRRIRAAGAPLPVVVITAHGDIPMAVQAIKLGAFDFVEKPFDDEPFLAVIRRALAAAAVVTVPAAASAGLHRLSRRERQVLDGILDGRANKLIARDLGLSPRTVEVYRANLMAKLNVHNVADLVRTALSSGDVPADTDEGAAPER